MLTELSVFHENCCLFGPPKIRKCTYKRGPNVLVVKLHSDLRILTQLQLVGVGVDFVFPLEEGRKEEEEVTPTYFSAEGLAVHA